MSQPSFIRIWDTQAMRNVAYNCDTPGKAGKPDRSPITPAERAGTAARRQDTARVPEPRSVTYRISVRGGKVSIGHPKKS